MVSFSPEVKEKFFQSTQGVNPFGVQRASSAGSAQTEELSGGISERHGAGKAAGSDSTGVIGEVTGTGDNGRHKIDMYG
ncbi:MAG: hypothetical protein LUB59_05670 [Candidatus Gastranaerophilales bacterium]|nr:hypothetical protein [Candidatus Gastranaerophilales bacterium]